MKPALFYALPWVMLLTCVACDPQPPAAAEKRLAAEIDVSVPVASAGKRSDALVIQLDARGAPSLQGREHTDESLLAALQEVARTNPKQAVIIRADAKTDYTRVVQMLELARKAGLYHVSFVTAAAPRSKQPKREEAAKAEAKTKRTVVLENANGSKTTVLLDSKGKARRAVVMSPENNPVGSIELGFDKTTGRFAEERHFDAKGRLVKRIFAGGGRPELPSELLEPVKE